MVASQSIDQLLEQVDLALYALECASYVASRDGLDRDHIEDETSRLAVLISHICRPARQTLAQAISGVRQPGSLLAVGARS